MAICTPIRSPHLILISKVYTALLEDLEKFPSQLDVLTAYMKPEVKSKRAESTTAKPQTTTPQGQFFLEIHLSMPERRLATSLIERSFKGSNKLLTRLIQWLSSLRLVRFWHRCHLEAATFANHQFLHSCLECSYP